MTRRTPGYRDVRTHYPQPQSGERISAGWFRQVGFNMDQMFAHHKISRGSFLAGAFEYTPSVIGFTFSAASAAYIPIGQIVYMWIQIEFSAVADDLNGFGLPIEPADTKFAMPAGHAEVLDASAPNCLPLTPIINPATGNVDLYCHEPSTGLYDSTKLFTAASGDVLTAYLKYRRDPPPDGQLSDLIYAPEAQE